MHTGIRVEMFSYSERFHCVSIIYEQHDQGKLISVHRYNRRKSWRNVCNRGAGFNFTGVSHRLVWYEQGWTIAFC